ncbi:MAG: DNA repair protein RecN [Epulopiscium sp.]|nr:DNA repair protein RecN [Candidatus Epulonipiscium sp.]
MLAHIYIKNIALIDEITIDFGENLNILTGETGAGKSILIDSINFALGERTSKEVIRSGEDNALVELLFYIGRDEQIESFQSMGIPIDEDRYLLISRAINQSGRNVCRVNGQTMTLGMLRQVSSMLIDVHGQHQHQSLLNVNKHIELLDQFCKEDIFELKNKLLKNYREYKTIEKEINDHLGDEKERERKIDLLQFQIDEISEAKLKNNEDIILNAQLKVLSNSEKLSMGIDKVYTFLYENDPRGISASDSLGEALKVLRDLSAIDGEISTIYETAENIQVQLEDISVEIRNYKDKIDHDPDGLHFVENRLDLIYNLKRKYGNTIDEILSYKERIDQELNTIINSEEKVKELRTKYLDIKSQIEETCENISTIRKEKAKEIEDKIEGVLHDLQMKAARFSISLSKKDTFNEDGWDDVEFLITTNPGEDLKPLTKIASGGEMSRIMLSLKTVLADIDEIDSLIFDEIDTGISGIAAQKVSEKLGIISRKHQVICITHLPQIAAMGDRHYRIEKTVEGQKAISSIKILEKKEAINELARLMSGAAVTDITLKNAEEIKNMAKQFKTKF